MNGEEAAPEATGWWARAKARWSYSEAASEETPVEKTPHDLLKELSDLAPAEAARTLKRRGDTKRRSRAYREARACYEAAYAAAETDDSAEAAYELSLLHAHGRGTPVDKNASRTWLRTAADLGAVRAMMFVAQMSTFGGGGFEKDEHVAFEYVRRAAEKDCVQAVQQLGVRLLYGVGCERDLQRAVDELERAVELGSVDSKEDLAKARNKLRQSKSCFRKLRKCCAKCCGCRGVWSKKLKKQDSALRVKAMPSDSVRKAFSPVSAEARQQTVRPRR